MTQQNLPATNSGLASSNSGHHRLHERLIEYWQELRDSRAFPSESDIDPADIAPIWDSCFLVQVRPGESYKYSYLGLALIEAWGNDAVSLGVGEALIDPATASLIHKFKEVVDTKRPVIDEAEFVNTKNISVKYRACMLPLGTAPDNVNYILGGMKWKAY